MSITRASLATLFALTLAACGGGDDTPAAGAPAPAPSVSVTPAPLVVSAATPATANGTLAKASAILETGISGSTGTYSSSGPNDYCRVAAYAMSNSGDGKQYDLTVIFSKSTKVVSYISLDGASPTVFNARANTGTGIVVDVTNRSIGFTNAVLGAGGTYSATLNGSLEYPTNGSVPDRANCG